MSFNYGCVLAARPKVDHENLVFCHALKRQGRSSVLLLSMTQSWIWEPRQGAGYALNDLAL